MANIVTDDMLAALYTLIEGDNAAKDERYKQGVRDAINTLESLEA